MTGVPWNFGEPAPSETYAYPPFHWLPVPSNGGGPDTYFPGERFWVDIDDLAVRDITITVTGQMQAITQWFVTAADAPEGPDAPGFQDLLPGFISALVTATIVIHNIPSPAGAALLGLGGLLAARRRP